jgi:hypothetical protein
MIYLSGSLFPLPDRLSWLMPLTPPFYLQQLMLFTAGAPHRFIVSGVWHVAVLTGITALFSTLAVRRFRLVG